MRKIQVCFPIEPYSAPFVVKAAINQLKKRITLVRIAVARFELMPVTPIFAKRAVTPANSAERSAQISHSICYGYRGGDFLSSIPAGGSIQAIQSCLPAD